jgi:hypothetical protein
MEERFTDRLKHAWNALTSRDPTYADWKRGSSYRPDKVRLNISNERSIIGSIYNRIGIDVAAMPIKHVRLNEDDRYIGTIDSGLNNALTLSANIDQTGRSFIQDVVMSMCDEGCVAIVPVDTTLNPAVTDSYDILTMRVGEIIEWFPSSVRLRVYNEKTGIKEEVTLPKSMVAIIENPLYTVMNEPNSTLKRLISKLNLLDSIDQQSGSGKLDLIIQLPYVIKTEARRVEANRRRQEVEDQLAGSKYGIAYTDGTEKVTQLNRPAENNLMAQIQYLTSMLYSQLGLTESVFDGTADEKTMLNYHNRTVKPILNAIVDEMKRKFLTKTAITQHQSIKYFRDAFALVPVNELANIADKFTRNEVLSSNDMRDVIGYKPSNDPEADKLRNKNLNKPEDKKVQDTNQNDINQSKGENKNDKSQI